jgi:hypothetical protein
LITITTGDLYIRANYQDFRRMPDVDLAIAADATPQGPEVVFDNFHLPQHASARREAQRALWLSRVSRVEDWL